jgi:hypothetical protein
MWMWMREEGGRDGFTFTTEKFGTIFPGKSDTLRDLAHELHDLRDMVVVFRIP